MYEYLIFISQEDVGDEGNKEDNEWDEVTYLRIRIMRRLKMIEDDSKNEVDWLMYLLPVRPRKPGR